jgi:hypothetical protein
MVNPVYGFPRYRKRLAERLGGPSITILATVTNHQLAWPHHHQLDP